MSLYAFLLSQSLVLLACFSNATNEKHNNSGGLHHLIIFLFFFGLVRLGGTLDLVFFLMAVTKFYLVLFDPAPSPWRKQFLVRKEMAKNWCHSGTSFPVWEPVLKIGFEIGFKIRHKLLTCPGTAFVEKGFKKI